MHTNSENLLGNDGAKTIHENSEEHRELSFHILTQIPENNDLLEGRGIYIPRGEKFVYNKGAGSIVALNENSSDSIGAFKKVRGKYLFGGINPELNQLTPRTWGSQSSEMASYEFLHALISEKANGIIPIATVSLPGITNRIQKEVEREMAEHHPHWRLTEPFAISSILVPSNIRLESIIRKEYTDKVSKIPYSRRDKLSSDFLETISNRNIPKIFYHLGESYRRIITESSLIPDTGSMHYQNVCVDQEDATNLLDLSDMVHTGFFSQDELNLQVSFLIDIMRQQLTFHTRDERTKFMSAFFEGFMKYSSIGEMSRGQAIDTCWDAFTPSSKENLSTYTSKASELGIQNPKERFLAYQRTSTNIDFMKLPGLASLPDFYVKRLSYEEKRTIIAKN